MTAIARARGYHDRAHDPTLGESRRHHHRSWSPDCADEPGNQCLTTTHRAMALKDLRSAVGRTVRGSVKCHRHLALIQGADKLSRRKAQSTHRVLQSCNPSVVVSCSVKHTTRYDVLRAMVNRRWPRKLIKGWTHSEPPNDDFVLASVSSVRTSWDRSVQKSIEMPQRQRAPTALGRCMICACESVRLCKRLL